MCAKVLHIWNGTRKFLSSLSCCSHFPSELSTSTSAAVAWRPLQPEGSWCEVTFSAPFHSVWGFYCLKPTLLPCQTFPHRKIPWWTQWNREAQKLQARQHLQDPLLLHFPKCCFARKLEWICHDLTQESERTGIINRESIIADDHRDTDVGETQNIGKPLWDNCLWILELFWNRETFPDKQIPSMASELPSPRARNKHGQ